MKPDFHTTSAAPLPTGLSPIHSSIADPDAVGVVSRLLRHGHRAYLVGGCVRDLLLGHPPKDFDIATSATPRQVKKVFRNSRIIGRRFRLVHVHFPGGKVLEVSTFRRDPRDEPTGAEEAVDPFLDRDFDPSSGESSAGDLAGEDSSAEDFLITRDNVFGTEREDALRRDFTINGLFYDVEHEEVLDYVGGVDDLRRGVLRTIGDPVQRVREDPVRILRAIKFVNRLGLTFDPGLAAAMAEHHEDLLRSAPPRVFEELLRLLGGPRPDRALKFLASFGVLRLLIPELELLPPSASEGDERLHHLLRRLEVVGEMDGRRSFSTAHYLAFLFHDEVLPILRRSEGGEAMLRLEEFLRPFSLRYRVSRRDSAQWRAMLLALKRIDPRTFPPRRRRRRRAPIHEFLRRSYFQDALELFRVLVRAEDRDRDLLEEWEERVAELARSPAPEPSEHDLDDDDPEEDQDERALRQAESELEGGLSSPPRRRGRRRGGRRRSAPRGGDF